MIANHQPNHLAGKMRADGIEPTIVTNPLIIENTEIRVIPHITGSVSDIDSAIIIKYRADDGKVHCVVNANDVIFDDQMRSALKEAAGNVDILLCGYTGAGPYPQTYFDANDPALIAEGENKKTSFFERYRKLVNIIDARVNIPFAGKYLLGGKLSELNLFRGVADPVDILDIDAKAIVLADNGGEINTHDYKPTELRTKRYDVHDVQTRINQICHHKMAYERLLVADEVKQLPLKRLLILAAHNAAKKSECDEDYYFCIKLPDNVCAVINANKNEKKYINFVDSVLNLPAPRSEIDIDPRYLFGLLTHVYHWNNAEVGSQYNTRRVPNVFNRKAQSYLSYLTV